MATIKKTDPLLSCHLALSVVGKKILNCHLHTGPIRRLNVGLGGGRLLCLDGFDASTSKHRYHWAVHWSLLMPFISTCNSSHLYAMLCLHTFPLHRAVHLSAVVHMS